MLRYLNKGGGGGEGRLKHSQTLHLMPDNPRKTSKKTKIDEMTFHPLHPNISLLVPYIVLWTVPKVHKRRCFFNNQELLSLVVISFTLLIRSDTFGILRD